MEYFGDGNEMVEAAVPPPSPTGNPNAAAALPPQSTTDNLNEAAAQPLPNSDDNWDYELTLNEAMKFRFNTVVTAISRRYNNDIEKQRLVWGNFCHVVTLPRYMFVSQDKIAAAVQTCMFTQCEMDHFNIPFEIVCPIKNNSGFFSNFIQHKRVMCMGILLQIMC